MKMFIVLVAVVLATSVSLFASADSSRGLSSRGPVAQSETVGANSRCARKISIGPGANEFACLMQKRKGRAA